MEINVNGKRHFINFSPQRLRTLVRDYDIDFYELGINGGFAKLSRIESMCAVGDIMHVISGGTFDPEDDDNFGYIARGEALRSLTECFRAQWDHGRTDAPPKNKNERKKKTNQRQLKQR